MRCDCITRPVRWQGLWRLSAKDIRGFKDLENRTVGISALGNAEHISLLFLMKRAGADSNRVRFATLGTNLPDALKLRQVDAGMVQEPALSLVTEAGGRVISNIMDIEEANRQLGGAYEFMGLAVRLEERASGAATRWRGRWPKDCAIPLI